jgi:hypothetical protein
MFLSNYFVADRKSRHIKHEFDILLKPVNWSMLLHKKLTVAELVIKYLPPEVYLITSTRVRHRSPPWCIWIRSPFLPPNFKRGRLSGPGRVKNFLFSTLSRPALGPTEPPIQRVPGGSLPGDKAAVEWSWPLIFNYCRDHENLGLHNHFPIGLNGVVLN